MGRSLYSSGRTIESGNEGTFLELCVLKSARFANYY
jgi:hypothetical protein